MRNKKLKKIILLIMIITYLCMLHLCIIHKESMDNSTTVIMPGYEKVEIFIEDFMDNTFAKTIIHLFCIVISVQVGLISYITYDLFKQCFCNKNIS